jgi:mycothiol synthase
VKLPPGYTARPATRDDLDEVAALIDAFDLAYFGDTDNANRIGLQFDWGAPWVDMERDTRVVHADDRTLAAYARHTRPDQSDRCETDGFVHPGHEDRGLGGAIVAWGEEQTRARMPGAVRAPLWTATGGTNDRGLRLFRDRGYHHIRTFWQMLLELDPTFEAGPDPEGVVVRRNVVGQDDRAGHAALEEAFATHFGQIPQSFEQWLERSQADETFDAGLGFVADVDGEIVGAAVNGIIDDVGWVYELGVRPAWQRRGVGRALLRRSLEMLAKDGVPVVRLGVDTENETGALDLYRSVGMRPVREWRVFEKLIGGR